MPHTIDERSLNKGAKLSIYQELENSELALRSAESIGCHIVNVRPKDIHAAREHLILGLLWQTIQVSLTYVRVVSSNDKLNFGSWSLDRTVR